VEIVPANAVTTITATFGDIVAANAVAIIAVLAFGLAITFVMRWFRKSAKLKG